MDLRKKRSQEKLQTALIEYLHLEAFEEITVEQLTKKAGVSRQTFYANYNSKQSILIHRLNAVFKGSSNIVAQKSRELKINQNTYLTRCLQAVYLECTREPILTKTAFMHIDGVSLQTVVRAFLEEQILPVLIDVPTLSSEDKKVLVDFYAGALIGSILSWLLNSHDTRNTQAPVKQLVALILHGIHEFNQSGSLV